MGRLGFFNHNWDHVAFYGSDHRYFIDDHQNVFIYHNEANEEPWVELMSIDQAREFFVEKIHKGWNQGKYLVSFMDSLTKPD